MPDGSYYARFAPAAVEAEKLRVIAALSPEMQVAMATWALKGYRFVFFPSNGGDRQWKAMDYIDGPREVHTAATLYVLLSALGKPS